MNHVKSMKPGLPNWTASPLLPPSIRNSKRTASLIFSRRSQRMMIGLTPNPRKKNPRSEKDGSVGCLGPEGWAAGEGDPGGD